MSKPNKSLSFTMYKTDDLIPYARNARTHSAEQVQKIAGSIKEFGFINPVIISDDGGILAGHGRVLAAQKLGIKEVPCVVESHLTDTQKRAYILADNRLSLDAGWDEEMLRLEIGSLVDEIDMSITGFSENELKRLTAEIAEYTSNIDSDKYGSQNSLVSEYDTYSQVEDGDITSRIPTPEEHGDMTKVSKLYYGRTMIPLTQQENEWLKSRLDEWIELNGSPYGFIGSIMQ